MAQNRKICDMAAELEEMVAAVESIILRIQLVTDPQDSHLLPGLMRELDLAAGRH